MLIGLMGPQGSGKDTVGDYLLSQNPNFVKRSMAEPLKKACKELFLFSDTQLYGTQAQKNEPDPKWFGCSPRTCLQYVGTDLLRDQLEKIMPGIGQDIFIHHFKLWYTSHSQGYVVVPDIRFQNEVDMIHQLGGYVIKLTRPRVSNLGFADPSLEKVDKHASEVALESITNYDWQIINNGTLEELYRKANVIMDYF